MAQLNQNFVMFKGDDKIIRFTVQDVESVVGLKARWTISSEPGSVSFLEKSTETSPPGITMDGKNIEVHLNSVDTDDHTVFETKKYYHECELVDGDGKISTVAIGEVDMRDVTLIRPIPAE